MSYVKASQRNKYLIGLTGGVASGKSTVAGYFSAYGIQIISADVIAKNQLSESSPTLNKVIELFGVSILNDEEKLDRSKLRELIFKNDQAREQLNAIMHPAILKDMFEQAKEAQSAYVILEIPLLVETGMQAHLDRIVVVDIDYNLQLQRIMQRDNCSQIHAEQIIAAQIDPQTRLNAADDVINNNSGTIKLEHQVALLHAKYSKDSRTSCSNGHGLNLH